MTRVLNISLLILWGISFSFLKGTADSFTAGNDWIANASVKLRLEHENSKFRKYYRLRYYRWNHEKKCWKELITGITPVTGMGYYLLAENVAPVKITIRKNNNNQMLCYRLEGYSSKPKKKIWVEYQLTILADSPCVIIELKATSDKRLKMMCRLGFAAMNASGVSTASRYVLYDKSISNNQYMIEVKDAVDHMGKRRIDYQYTRFTASYAPLNGSLIALFGLEQPPDAKNNRIFRARGTGFGQFQISAPCALYAENIAGITDIDDIAFYVENNYYKFRKILDTEMKTKVGK